jgi:hypothetical protein
MCAPGLYTYRAENQGDRHMAELKDAAQTFANDLINRTSPA